MKPYIVPYEYSGLQIFDLKFFLDKKHFCLKTELGKNGLKFSQLLNKPFASVFEGENFERKKSKF